MNKKRALTLILSLIISTSLFYGLSVSSAKDPILYKGTFDTWYSDPNAKIVESSWKVTNFRGRTVFVSKFTELNIAEETPGTYDFFVIWMQTDNVEIVDDIVTISGTANLYKNGALILSPVLVITINPDNLNTQFQMTTAAFWINGSLLP